LKEKNRVIDHPFAPGGRSTKCKPVERFDRLKGVRLRWHAQVTPARCSSGQLKNKKGVATAAPPKVAPQGCHALCWCCASPHGSYLHPAQELHFVTRTKDKSVPRSALVQSARCPCCARLRPHSDTPGRPA